MGDDSDVAIIDTIKADFKFAKHDTTSESTAHYESKQKQAVIDYPSGASASSETGSSASSSRSPGFFSENFFNHKSSLPRLRTFDKFSDSETDASDNNPSPLALRPRVTARQSGLRPLLHVASAKDATRTKPKATNALESSYAAQADESPMLWLNKPDTNNEDAAVITERQDTKFDDGATSLKSKRVTIDKSLSSHNISNHTTEKREKIKHDKKPYFNHRNEPVEETIRKGLEAILHERDCLSSKLTAKEFELDAAKSKHALESTQREGLEDRLRIAVETLGQLESDFDKMADSSSACKDLLSDLNLQIKENKLANSIENVINTYETQQSALHGRMRELVTDISSDYAATKSSCKLYREQLDTWSGLQAEQRDRIAYLEAKLDAEADVSSKQITQQCETIRQQNDNITAISSTIPEISEKLGSLSSTVTETLAIQISGVKKELALKTMEIANQIHGDILTLEPKFVSDLQISFQKNCSNSSDNLLNRLQKFLNETMMKNVVDTCLANLKTQLTKLSEKASEESTLVQTSLTTVKQRLERFDQLFQQLDKSEDQTEELVKILEERDAKMLKLKTTISNQDASLLAKNEQLAESIATLQEFSDRLASLDDNAKAIAEILGLDNEQNGNKLALQETLNDMKAFLMSLDQRTEVKDKIFDPLLLPSPSVDALKKEMAVQAHEFRRIHDQKLADFENTRRQLDVRAESLKLELDGVKDRLRECEADKKILLAAEKDMKCTIEDLRRQVDSLTLSKNKSFVNKQDDEQLQLSKISKGSDTITSREVVSKVDDELEDSIIIEEGLNAAEILAHQVTEDNISTSKRRRKIKLDVVEDLFLSEKPKDSHNRSSQPVKTYHRSRRSLGTK